jgi:hypothetical protein
MYGSGNKIEQSLPSDEGLANHLAFVGNIYHLHDLVLWENWQSAFVPTQGVEELTRVRDTVHRLDARLMVYASPQYFTRGTPSEKLATGAQLVRDTGKMRPGPPWYGGENMDLFLEEIDRVINEYGMDGLYFDGLYCNSLVQAYRLMRIATDALWQRYLISGYNISNAIGMPEHNKVPEAERRSDAFIDAILNVNGRFYYHGALGRERIVDYYLPQLTDRLKDRVERVMAERNAAFTETKFFRSPGTE